VLSASSFEIPVTYQPAFAKGLGVASLRSLRYESLRRKTRIALAIR